MAARTSARASRDALDVAIDNLERLWDPFDAIWRRGRADQVFRRLAAFRISHARAQQVLQALTARQKGGWLRKGWRRS
jgi:hypothetical protein